MVSEYPDWVLKCKKKGIAIEKRGEKFYASRVTSVWDSKKKRARKKTLEYLGVVSPMGIIPSKSKKPIQLGGSLEAGNIAFVESFTKTISESLSEIFPQDWESLLAAAVLKLCYLEKLNRFSFRYETSLAKNFWPSATLSKNSITKLLERIGSQWELQRKFFEKISTNEKHMAIDLSQLFSYSKNIPLLEKGYNHEGMWIPQVTLLLLWGISSKRPGYLKVLSGATSSAQTISNLVKEARLKGVIAVVDKGFWSKENKEVFDKENSQYVMALKRDLPFVDHKNSHNYKKYFRYNKQVQWWRKTEFENCIIYHVLDKRLAAEEEASCLELLEQKKITKKEFLKKKSQFGTISLLTNTGLTAEETYLLYKERQSIEVAFDALKNTLGADTTWMQNQNSLRGYMFIAFLALHLYSQILDYLKRKKIQNKSVNDILTYLTKIQVITINKKTHLSPITKQTKKILDALELPITQNLGN
ncbi:MAG: transposase [archaeon]